MTRGQQGSSDSLMINVRDEGEPLGHGKEGGLVILRWYLRAA